MRGVTTPCSSSLRVRYASSALGDERHTRDVRQPRRFFPAGWVTEGISEVFDGRLRLAPGGAKKYGILPVVNSQAVMIVGPHRREKSTVSRKLYYGDGTPMKPLQHCNSAHVLQIPDDDLVDHQMIILVTR